MVKIHIINDSKLILLMGQNIDIKVSSISSQGSKVL